MPVFASFRDGQGRSLALPPRWSSDPGFSFSRCSCHWSSNPSSSVEAGNANKCTKGEGGRAWAGEEGSSSRPTGRDKVKACKYGRGGILSPDMLLFPRAVEAVEADPRPAAMRSRDPRRDTPSGLSRHTCHSLFSSLPLARTTGVPGGTEVPWPRSPFGGQCA